MRSAAVRGLQVLLVVTFTLALSAAGLLGAVDDWFYDALLARLSPAAPARVLVVEGQPAQVSAGDALWLRLLRTLRGAGARHIVFTFMPAQASPTFYEASARAGVVFGRRPLPQPERGNGAAFAALPPGALDVPLRLAVAEAWPAPVAVQRSQQPRFRGDTGPLPALEVLAAADAGAEARAEPYRIDFGAEPLPRLSIVRVLSGELAPEQLADKVVVVGPAGDAPVFTPAGPLPALQFHAHAIDTLLRGAAIEEVPAWLRAGVLVGMVVLAWALPGRLGGSAARPRGGRRGRWPSMRLASVPAELWVPAGLALLLLALSAGLLAGRWWLPPAEPVLALALVALASAVARRARSDRLLAALQADASARVDRLVLPPAEAAADASWHEVRTLVTHSLPLQRSLFLALNPATGRLREALAIGCDLGDVAERRRDASRVPYRQAAAPAQAVEAAPYLRPGDAEEVQFLVPLSFGGRLEGMWALGVQRAELQRTADFHHALDALASDIARRLGAARRQAPAAKRPPAPAASSQPPPHTHTHLHPHPHPHVHPQPPLRQPSGGVGIQRALALLDQQAAGPRKALERLDTAAAAFDELGRPWFVNAAMKRVLEGLELDPAPAAGDLLAGVAGVPADDVRRMLRRVVVHGEQLRLGNHRVRTGAAYQLTLTPVPPEPDGTALYGLVCELVDMSAAVQRAETDELLRRRARVRLSGSAAALTVAGLRLAEGSPAAGGDAQQLRRMTELVRNEALKALQALDSVLHPQDDIGPAHRTVDLGGAVDRVLADLAGPLEARRIAVARTGREAAVLVRAEPGELHHLLKAVFELLLTDCADAGAICMQSDEAAGRVRCRFANTGGGMPNKQFLDGLAGTQAGVSPEFTRLRNASRLVHRWGGTLRGASDVGLGTRFELTLQVA